MKPNIQKFLVGGRSYFSAGLNPFFGASTQAPSTTTAASESIISKGVMDDLIKNGIPTDVDNFMLELAAFEHKTDFGLGVSKSELYALKAKANRVIQASNYLNKAETEATKNGALDEVAVDQRGYFYTVDESGKLSKTSIKDFDGSKQLALTVGELIEHRKYSSSLTNNPDVATVIGTNIGTEKINDYIKGIITAIGSTETSSEAYIDLASVVGKEAAKKPTEQQLESIREMYTLMQKLGPDALFKIKDSEKSKNLNSAMNYILSMLPKNMQNQLIGRYVSMGGDYEDCTKHIYDIVATALNMNNDIKVSHGMEYDSGINKAAGTQAGSKEQNRNLKVLETLIQGSLNKIDYNLTSSKNPSLNMILHGNVIGALTNFDNNVIPKAPMSMAIENSIGPLIDKNHVTMGTQKINESMFDTILYDGNDVINIWAPTDNNGDIDLDGLWQFNELLQLFDRDPSLTVLDKNNILQEYGISGHINEDGSFTGSGNMAKFLVFTGITSSKVISNDNAFADVITGDQESYEKELIKRIYGYLNDKKENKHGEFEFRDGWFSDILKAPVFMKLKPTAQTEVGTFSNHGPLVQTQSYNEQLTRDLLRYDLSHSNQLIYQPSTNLLFQ